MKEKLSKFLTRDWKFWYRLFQITATHKVSQASRLTRQNYYFTQTKLSEIIFWTLKLGTHRHGIWLGAKRLKSKGWTPKNYPINDHSKWLSDARPILSTSSSITKVTGCELSHSQSEAKWCGVVDYCDPWKSVGRFCDKILLEKLTLILWLYATPIDTIAWPWVSNCIFIFGLPYSANVSTREH